MEQILGDADRARMYLADLDFHFSRALGQNFLLDDGWNRHIAECAGVEENDNVLEIGPGAGTLTCALARCGANVLAVEIDRTLETVLTRMLEPWPNAKVLYGDIMKQDIAVLADEHFGKGAPYSVVSNLPYAIAAELLPKLACMERAPERVIAMVQREAAERMCAGPGEKNWCALAARMQYFNSMNVLDILPAHAFTPNAHVESALIRADRYLPEERPAQPKDENMFLRTVDAAFAMRRKTMANNLTMAFGIPREKALAALEAAGQSATVRGEVLTLAELADVADALTEE